MKKRKSVKINTISVSDFQIDEVFHVVTSGTVVSGTLSQGMVREGDKVVVGPTESGEFIPVTVTSIHRNRTPVRVIRSGQAASVAISNVERNELRRVSFLDIHTFYWRF